MKVAIVAGGSGGHIYPAIAVAEELLADDMNARILFIGSEEGIEKEIISRERFSLKLIKAKKVMRKLSVDLLRLPFMVFAGIAQSKAILKEFKPDVLLSTGGYVSFPVVIAAAALKVPILIHEQNTVPGLTNRICQLFAKKVAVSYAVTSKYFIRSKTSLTGNPVRSKVIRAVRSVSRQKLNLDQKRKTLLVLGGSQGAHRINEAVAGMIDFFSSEDIQVVHLTGAKDYQWVLSQTENRVLNIEEAVPVLKGRMRQMTLRRYRLYHPMPYMYNIWDGLAASDLVLCRAGATAIAEITARGLPSIIIPFPYASESHQKSNAAILSNAGASIVIDEAFLSVEGLKDTIRSLFSDRALLAKMSQASKGLYVSDSLKRLVGLLYQAAGRSKQVKGPAVKQRPRKAKKTDGPGQG